MPVEGQVALQRFSRAASKGRGISAFDMNDSKHHHAGATYQEQPIYYSCISVSECLLLIFQIHIKAHETIASHTILNRESKRTNPV